LKTAGWQKYSHEVRIPRLHTNLQGRSYTLQQYGLPAWGASGPYQKVYEKFGITGTSKLARHTSSGVTDCGLDIAAVSKKVIAFYKQKGGEVVSPLVKAIKL